MVGGSPPGGPRSSGSGTDLIHFLVGQDRYAIPLQAVDEIIGLADFDADGVDWRGSRLPVRRAHDALGLERAPSTTYSRGIVVRSGGARVVLAVERVLAVDTADSDAIVPPPAFPVRSRASLVKGVIVVENATIVVIEPTGISTEDVAATETGDPREEVNGG
jgi:chemotaxis signal transduction protein